MLSYRTGAEIVDNNCGTRWARVWPRPAVHEDDGVEIFFSRLGIKQARGPTRSFLADKKLWEHEVRSRRGDRRHMRGGRKTWHGGVQRRRSVVCFFRVGLGSGLVRGAGLASGRTKKVEKRSRGREKRRTGLGEDDPLIHGHIENTLKTH